MQTTSLEIFENKYGPPRLNVELANICNLHCDYCLRDDDALYNVRAEFFPVDLLQRILREAREVAEMRHVGFTGGEVTLHPSFSEVLDVCAAEGFKTSFVTNGWHFEKVWPAVLRNRESVSHVAFSLDGATQQAHDGWRGEGSFVRLIRAFTRCHQAQFPFQIKVGIRKDTIDHLEEIAMFAARMGASNLAFAHLLPTSQASSEKLGLTRAERKLAEEEIALLARVFKMKIRIDVGYDNINTDAPCSPLAGTTCNIDYRGRLTLCCNLSGFRGGINNSDIVGDLNEISFREAYEKFHRTAEHQLERRRLAIESAKLTGDLDDPNLLSPCLFCLKSHDKLPWLEVSSTASVSLGSRSLPVVVYKG